MASYKVWLQVEECDHEAEEYTNTEGPICLDEFDTPEEANRFFRALATLFSPGNNSDYAYPVEPEAPR